MTSSTPSSQSSKQHRAKDSTRLTSTKNVKMTKEQRRTKYTEIARKRRQKQHQPSDMRGGRVGDSGKKNVCYHCRQPGHKATSCPETQDKTTGMSLVEEGPESVLCYKCGSTEHALHQCPQKNRGDRNHLPHAKCFVCSEKGHLASSCPKNTKGIYVNGGCCRKCGSQQHLATDCPEKKRKKESGSVEDEDSKKVDLNFDDLIAKDPISLINRDQQATTQTTKKKRVVIF